MPRSNISEVDLEALANSVVCKLNNSVIKDVIKEKSDDDIFLDKATTTTTTPVKVAEPSKPDRPIRSTRLKNKLSKSVEVENRPGSSVRKQSLNVKNSKNKAKKKTPEKLKSINLSRLEGESDSDVIILSDTNSDTEPTMIIHGGSYRREILENKSNINSDNHSPNSEDSKSTPVISSTLEPELSFFIDKKPSSNTTSSSSTFNVDDDLSSEADEWQSDLNDSDEEDLHETKKTPGLKAEDSDHVKNRSKRKTDLSSSMQEGDGLCGDYVNVKSMNQPENNEICSKSFTGKLPDKDKELMKKSVITPDFEKKDRILPYTESRRSLKEMRRRERSKTKGTSWFNMPATELTEEKKNDLKILQMRHALDPKRFYRANDMSAPPKFFQFGTVVESKADFYSSRIPKKQRKATLVDELFADAEFRKYNKRKYVEIQEAKRMGVGPYQKVRFAKKKKKKT